MTPDSELGEKIARSAIIAVLVIDRADDAIPVARALMKGGIDAMELTLRTDSALQALHHVRREAPGMLAGIGTILTPRHADQAHETGAHFGVAPGVNAEVVMHAKHIGLPFCPGVMTPTDIDLSLNLGCRLLKYFPASTSGGLKHLQNIAAPFKHLGVGFIPLGGINADNLRDYLDSPLVTAVGGSWLAPREVIADQDWAEISRRAEKARSIAES